MSAIKTAISLEQDLFDEVGALAKEMLVSRSRVFALAVRAYVKQYRNRQVLEQLNAVYKDQNEDALIQQSRRSHRKLVLGEW